MSLAGLRPAFAGRALALGTLVLLASALGPGVSDAAEPVKLLLPEQYAKRIVAPRKGRVLVVNFWATWCEPCRDEMPALSRAAQAFLPKDVAVVLVSMDSLKTGPTVVPKFLVASKIGFVCWLLKSRDPQVFIDTVDKSWDGSLPYTVIYGRDGKPALKLSGQQTEKSFSDSIRKVLAAS